MVRIVATSEQPGGVDAELAPADRVTTANAMVKAAAQVIRVRSWIAKPPLVLLWGTQDVGEANRGRGRAAVGCTNAVAVSKPLRVRACEVPLLRHMELVPRKYGLSVGDYGFGGLVSASGPVRMER